MVFVSVRSYRKLPQAPRRAGVTQGTGAGEVAGPWNLRPRAPTSWPTWPKWWSASSASCPPRRCCAPPGKGRGLGVRGGRLRFAGAVPPTRRCCVALCCSVCRLWRECARRTLRTRQRIAWVSALEPGPAENHALVRALARELEVRGASSTPSFKR